MSLFNNSGAKISIFATYRNKNFKKNEKKHHFCYNNPQKRVGRLQNTTFIYQNFGAILTFHLAD